VSSATPPADVAAVVDRLLDDYDPSGDPTAFLGAVFDAGLAWIAEPEARQITNSRLRSAGAPDPFLRSPIGVGMVGPTILHHGSDAQRERYLRNIWSGAESWCQLFSEPGSGSDLASLSTRAVRDETGWLVNGQKVWTSGADHADHGLLLARTDVEAPKRAGITAFLIAMDTPGVTVRPLRQMTGDAEFNEVFFEDVHLPSDARLGDEGDGWNVAFTTLMNERASIGDAFGSSGAGPVAVATELYRERHREDATARDAVARMYIEAELLRLLATRAGTPGPAGSVLKLFGAEHVRRVYEVIVTLLGPEGMVSDDGGQGSPWTRGPHVAFLRSRAATIEGGSSEVMRNILAERVLGLPREPDPYSRMPWKDVPRS